MWETSPIISREREYSIREIGFGIKSCNVCFVSSSLLLLRIE